MFDMKRRGVLIWKRENVKKIVGITSPDSRKIKSEEEDGYKNLRILEYDDPLHGHKKKVLKKEYFPKTKDIPMSVGKYDAWHGAGGWRSKLK